MPFLNSKPSSICPFYREKNSKVLIKAHKALRVLAPGNTSDLISHSPVPVLQLHHFFVIPQTYKASFFLGLNCSFLSYCPVSLFHLIYVCTEMSLHQGGIFWLAKIATLWISLSLSLFFILVCITKHTYIYIHLNVCRHGIYVYAYVCRDTYMCGVYTQNLYQPDCTTVNSKQIINSMRAKTLFYWLLCAHDLG